MREGTALANDDDDDDGDGRNVGEEYAPEWHKGKMRAQNLTTQLVMNCEGLFSPYFLPEDDSAETSVRMVQDGLVGTRQVKFNSHDKCLHSVSYCKRKCECLSPIEDKGIRCAVLRKIIFSHLTFERCV